MEYTPDKCKIKAHLKNGSKGQSKSITSSNNSQHSSSQCTRRIMLLQLKLDIHFAECVVCFVYKWTCMHKVFMLCK